MLADICLNVVLMRLATIDLSLLDLMQNKHVCFMILLASANKFFDPYICTLISLDKLPQYLCITCDDCIEQMQARQQLVML